MPITGGAQVSNIAELLREVFEPGFTEALNRSNALLQFFKRETFPGKEIRWKIHYEGNLAASSYAETDNLPVADHQKVKNAAVPYRLNWVPIQVTNFALAATKGEGGFVDLLSFETKNALEDLKNEINRQMMVDRRSNILRPTDIDGFGAIIDDGQVDAAATGYAGLSFATNPWWKPYVLANGGTARNLTIALMQQVRRALLAPPRRSRPDRIITAMVHYDQYGDLMASLRRYPPTSTLDAGYPSLAFEQIKVVGIPELPAGSMYFVQSSDWGYYVLQNFRTEEKPVNGDARYFIITHYSQLVCRALHRQGRIADLAT
ncbi:MAG: phage major capsid protein [Candidatus Caldarchaeum sp.]